MRTITVKQSKQDINRFIKLAKDYIEPYSTKPIVDILNTARQSKKFLYDCSDIYIEQVANWLEKIPSSFDTLFNP